MSLQEKINSDLTIAIKTKSTGRRDVLRVVIGEMNRVGKELEDKQLKEGNKALIGFFIGKCVEMTEGSADNKKISEILKSKI